MDTRLQSLVEKYDEETDQLIIKQDHLGDSIKFKEAIIYNLVQKLEAKNDLEKIYMEQLVQTKGYPDFLKYYIHIPYLLPTLTLFFGYMKYKKKLTFNLGMSVICTSVVFNEFSRYKRVMFMNKQKAQKYTDHQANYKYLIGKYLDNNKISTIPLYVLGIDIQQTFNKKDKQIYYDDTVNDEITIQNYL